MIRLSSPNFDERKAPVEMLVLHYTGMKSAQEALDRLCDPAAKVSAHYLVDANGEIYSLVDETKRAWHAGVSSWRGKTDINSQSIGIEIVNPGHEFGYRPFSDAQIAAVIKLCQTIQQRCRISAKNVLAHSDVAPMRKSDPGELFPWKKLAKNGIGLWTDGLDTPEKDKKDMLAAIGYDITDESAALTAFQRHFYPEALLNRASETDKRLAAVFNLFNESTVK
ncbi:MAG: N-acetylmuramoyl-L-alanine amidase [Alphaproteobacteria bacterium]|nr:N-acetylmuramoyl-L-alanine amidase [Alphaproteobacteria bacterium]